MFAFVTNMTPSKSKSYPFVLIVIVGVHRYLRYILRMGDRDAFFRAVEIALLEEELELEAEREQAALIA